MSDDQVTVVQEGGSNAGKWLLLLLAAIYVAGSLYFLVDMHNSVGKLVQDQGASQKQIADLTTRMQAAEAEAETLGQQVGITKKELAQRAAQLQASQRAAEERLAKEQKEQITAVTGEVAGVKTDVGGVKTDLGETKNELAATKAKLESTVGDLGLQSGLIAQHARRSRSPEAQGRSAVLRVHIDEGCEAGARVDRQSAAQEVRRQAWQVHAQRYLRR